MLSDPFLQSPTPNSVTVVWFTEFEGNSHYVIYGETPNHQAKALSRKLSRVFEDDNLDKKPKKRNIWRHEALVTGLTKGLRVPYQVVSLQGDQEYKSKIFSLAPKPEPATPLKILLTSDHQLMPLTAANLQKVQETIGMVDGIFFAGDLVNVPDRASEWFDTPLGNSFFPCLQGRASYELTKNGTSVVYRGGELIQHAPMYTAIGNHEVMGRYFPNNSLKEQFSDAYPRIMAEVDYENHKETINPNNDPIQKEHWIKAHSFNVNTYEDIFTLPESISGGKKYYSLTFGDIWLGVLYVTNIWRVPQLNPKIPGRYQEAIDNLNDPQKWGYGQHIFEPIAAGSPQYLWLEKELETEEFKNSKYKIVMFHHPPHTLGGNIVPPYTDPIVKKKSNDQGNIEAIFYEYPPEKDYIIRDLIPLLEKAKIQLVFFGHSHLWNRFVSTQGMNFLETSNVGNSYGAHYSNENPRPIPENTPYVAIGDPNGLQPIIPTLEPQKDELGQPLPYIASNDITVFSILDTSDGKVSSYCFNTCEPEKRVRKFDEFKLI